MSESEVVDKSEDVCGSKILLSQVYALSNLKNSRDQLCIERTNGIKVYISDARLEKLSRDIKRQKFKPTPVRRVQVPKSTGSVRYLGITSAIDKVVHGVLLKLLKDRLENEFSSYSYGCRDGRSCHDALKFIKYN